MTPEKPIYLCSPVRTAIGSLQGALATIPAPDLGSIVFKEILSRLKLDPLNINEVIVGTVLSAGQGQAPARQVAIKSGLSPSSQALTINKVCSSGLKAVMLACDSIALGNSEAVLAGGIENMSLAPYLLPKFRAGARLGNAEAVDSLIHDALWDVYNQTHMGNCAELCAEKYQLTREQQDQFAIESYRRANDAIAKGYFKEEIVPVLVSSGKATLTVDTDEEPGKGAPEKIPQLKPVFKKEGTVTAANASSINDGAAGMLVCSEKFLKEHKLSAFARVIAYGFHAQAPEWFTTAPVGAVQNALSRAGLSMEDIDLFEINEAFSAVALACAKDLEIAKEKLNVSGGAVALGHPVGASGARVLTTLLYSLKRLQLKCGVVGICNGGGEATAIVVERQ